MLHVLVGIFVSLCLFHFTDNRQDVCYMDLPCRNTPNLAVMNKAQCCCSLSAAWGRYCERCPQVNTRKKYFITVVSG